MKNLFILLIAIIVVSCQNDKSSENKVNKDSLIFIDNPNISFENKIIDEKQNSNDLIYNVHVEYPFLTNYKDTSIQKDFNNITDFFIKRTVLLFANRRLKASYMTIKNGLAPDLTRNPELLTISYTIPTKTNQFISVVFDINYTRKHYKYHSIRAINYNLKEKNPVKYSDFFEKGYDWKVFYFKTIINYIEKNNLDLTCYKNYITHCINNSYSIQKDGLKQFVTPNDVIELGDSILPNSKCKEFIINIPLDSINLK